jgi:hypothetical protein
MTQRRSISRPRAGGTLEYLGLSVSPRSTMSHCPQGDTHTTLPPHRPHCIRNPLTRRVQSLASSSTATPDWTDTRNGCIMHPDSIRAHMQRVSEQMAAIALAVCVDHVFGSTPLPRPPGCQDCRHHNHSSRCTRWRGGEVAWVRCQRSNRHA